MAETPGKLFTLLAQITRDGEEGRTWAEEDRMDREEARGQFESPGIRQKGQPL